MSGYKNDTAFEAVLQNTGQNIEAFIDDFFSFLARRSDFFVVSPPEGGRIGFPPGIAAKLVISKFKKWEQYSIQRKDVPVPSPAVKHEVAHTNQAPATEVAQTSQNEVKPKEVLSNVKPVPSSSKPNSSKKTDSFIKKDNEANPVGLWDAHNGRKTDKYSWSQSIKELDVYVAVHEDVKTKKQIKVEINMNFIRVVTGVGTNSEVSIDWKLSHPIIKDESYWSLHPGESIFLSLQKAKERWWDHLFEGEEPIDRTKIEAVRPMEDLEEEEQVKIQELVWNQEQKLKGLPTSDELKMEEVMRKAWDAEGSPFKGQPFDMSQIKVASNTIGAPDLNAPS